MSYQRTNFRPNDELQLKIISSPPDKVLLTVVGFLVVLGLMFIFSATAPKLIDAGTNPAKAFLNQLITGVIPGFIGMLFFTNMDYRVLKKYDGMFAWIVVILLALVEFTPLGVTINEAKRWLAIGPLQFQPSEFAKLAVVMLLARAFCDDAKVFDSRKFTMFFLPILIMIALVFKQPNLSMVIILGLTSIVMYIVSGANLKILITTAIAGTIGVFSAVIGGLTGVLKIIKPYQLSRITIWLNPESDPLGAGYNVIQSLVAFATGGLFGVGYGASKQKLAWLPECHTDFIFAVIGEELGFLGCFFVIGLFLTLVQRGFLIATRCPETYGKLLAVGITFSLGFQALLNMSVASSFLPATGVPLPFISYGSSSLWVSMVMIGILLNISKKSVKKVRKEMNVRYL
ncbi:cell division protein FtsW [bacterium]|nr:cell division protein FtsW [bacterium]